MTINPEQIDKLPAAIHNGFIDAFSSSLHTVFLAGVPIAIVAFVLALILKEVPLRGAARQGLEEAVAEASLVETGVDGAVAASALPPLAD